MKNIEKKHIINGINNLNPNKKYTCLTGMRPSGRLHLGHYKGALENWLKMQENLNIDNYFLIADYQVLGDHLGDTNRLRNSVIDMIIDWMAVGLDPKKCNFVVQSYVPSFSELFNLLTMFIPYNIALNNPTLKDEMKKIKERKDTSISLGFINYPVSQVADIMLPGGQLVPVGEDQVPHIELARKVIKKINEIYKTKFPLPLALLSENPRLVGTDGNDKMSKSLGNTIYLTASLKEIKKGVNSMYTDPNKISIEDKGNIDNHVVFKYLDVFYDDKENLEKLKQKYIKGGKDSIGDGYIKKLLVEVLDNFIAPIREKREYYLNNMDLVLEAIEIGSKNMNIVGDKTLNELKDKMGILNY